MRKAEREERSAELLTRVGAHGRRRPKVQTYSGGMKRRPSSALALVHKPRILFLDEPTTGSIRRARSALWTEAAGAKEEGRHGFF